ncbi:RNA-binding protein 12B [Eublepharis macularius]|uniref:RNA-binding protein 12B n=1 Tax=Eublepharis macularius TaxID=481883 RepID=A0AA97JPY0_EUBMA|nr:RNA-binding protein 12B [Eublepharis macularius]XP_054841387.1 RNA-binding protein 12B [Eublepharis macularius]XP_054841388.1 RNA-binding protein 12B [Eublepharis macularius]
MAVVIRLQGLPVVAGSADIRRFFSGLNIPDGGVHIIGGEKGEAFIIFATDEDARQGMSFSGRFVKDSRIELFLSSKTEMQNIIEVNRKRYDHGGRETVTGSRRTGSSNSGVGNLSNLVAAIKKGIGKSSFDSLDNLEDDFHLHGSQNSNAEVSKSTSDQSKKESDNLYVFVRGMPYSASENDVLNFFSGLHVEGVILLENDEGRPNGDGLVKFATPSDAMKGLQRDREYMGPRFLELRPSNQRTWLQYGGGDEKMDNSFKHFAQLNKESSSSRRESNYMSSRKQSHSRSPPWRVLARSRSRSPPQRVLARSRSRSPPQRVLARSRSRSPPQRVLARSRSRSPPQRVLARSRSRSPQRVLARSRSRSPPQRVMARSRSRSPPQRVLARSRSRSPPQRVMARSRSRSPPQRVMARSRSRSPRRRVLARSRSRSLQRAAAARSHSPLSHSAFSHSSNSREFYIHIKNLSPDVDKRDLRAFFGALNISNHNITLLKPDNPLKKREAFVQFKSIREYETALTYHKESLFGQRVHIFPSSKNSILQFIESSEAKRSSERHHHVKEKRDGCAGQKTCVYVRNFPFDVTNVEVQKFFAGFNIDDSDIHLLYDDKGTGLGEALVKFRSEDQARKAETLNRRRFLGTEVLLRCISEEQMQEFGINVSSVSSEKMQANPHAHARGEHFYAVGSQGPSMQGKFKHPSDYRCPKDFLRSPDRFRGPPSFPEFHGEGNPGGFPEGRFMPDSNFSSGSDHITVIKLKNIPFRAAPNEILDFFHGYKIIPESLVIHHNEYGMPSGEATLALVNYNEAVAAVNELNDRPFGHRKVRLTLA